MARKYDRYGRNRQFRRNPTRSPKFFPYRLPFQSDFRFLRGNGTEVSAATASRWRQVISDITNPNKRKRDDYLSDDDDDRYYERMQYTQSQQMKAGLDNVKRVQAKAMEIALNGIPVGRSIAAFDLAVTREIDAGFALHRKWDELGLIKWHI